MSLNLLRGDFDQTDPSGWTVIFYAPAPSLASGRLAVTLDFGDGSPTWASDATGKVVHTYAPLGGNPRVVTPTLTDGDGKECGRQRFEIPRGPYRPFNVAH